MKKKQHLFFIGIVGHAMRGLALAAKYAGHTVTGLDEAAAHDVGAAWLTGQGIDWTRTPDPRLLDGVDLVIISGGIPADYPLLKEILRRRIPVQSFAQYLGAATQGKHVIAVAGTHGKTTTTSLIAWLLDAAGRRPDYLVGIRPFNFDISVRLSGADTIIIEGDEYKSSSLDPRPKLNYYHPDTLVITSIEHDHPDLYPDLESVIQTFAAAAAALPPTGHLVAWAESPVVAEVARSARCPVITYGLEAGNYTAANIAYQPGGLAFDVLHGDQTLGRLQLPLYGRHNIQNALAAVAVAVSEGLTPDQIIAAAPRFQGAYRRFTILTPPTSPVTVIDDYAHHPTEVATTLEAARLHFPHRRLIAVFRPHTYSRTSALLADYPAAFTQAAVAYITDIEGAREAGATQPVSGRDLAGRLTVPAHFISDRADLIKALRRDTKPGDVIVCMTVSGYADLAEELAAQPVQ